jgi:prepilin-type N-terminal cleavage/methylation domain-containing protein
MRNIKSGFTLIELLVVLAIISILMVVVFAALNPAVRLRDSRNARRWSNVNELLTAIHECLVDNNGIASSCGLADDGSVRQVGTCTSGGATNCPGADAACESDIEAAPMTSYIAFPPIDPMGSAATTGYSIKVSSGIVTVSACLAEGTTILVSR